MDVFSVCLTGLVLAVLSAFRFRTELSRFEINRLAVHGGKYKTLARFLDIYPGLIIMVRILALVDVIFLTIFAAFSWGFLGGGAAAFAVILLALLIGRLFHGTAETLVGKHLEFFNKYFAWAGTLGRLVMAGDEPQISSEHELLHLIDQGDFLDDRTKTLLVNMLAFRDQTVEKAMTPRDRIAFLHVQDSLTPKLLDELFASGRKIFPVVRNGLDHTVGLLYLDDALPVEQEEKNLAKIMRKCPPPIETGAPLEAALNQMSEYHTTVLLAAKKEKIVGLITIKDIISKLF
jgi:CBS domain containing-hemolysin-like protein